MYALMFASLQACKHIIQSYTNAIDRRIAPAVPNNRIAAPPADGFADRLHGVLGKASLDNKAPSSDNSSA